jgi:hypothetical protein
MKILRRISGNIDSRSKKRIIEHALKTKLDDGHFRHDLDENSEEYSVIKHLVDSLNLYDRVIGTEFIKEEIETADTLVLRGVWASGYPQPEDPISVGKNTYFDSCPECGIHGEQKAPFQIKEPKLGKHKIMQLNWVNDEMFVERDFYERYFKKFGIGIKEANLYRKDEPVKAVVQLDIPKAEFALDMGGLEFSTCLICKKIKYTPVNIGFSPAPSRTNFHIIKTQEFFGSGHSAFNKILMSNEISDDLIKARLAKYYNFVPTK